MSPIERLNTILRRRAMPGPDDAIDARTRKPTAADADRAATLMLGMWDGGGRDELRTLLGRMEPLTAATAAATLAGHLFERNVMDWADLVEHLDKAR